MATSVPLRASVPSLLTCSGAVSNADTRSLLTSLGQREDLVLPPSLMRVLRAVGVRRMVVEERFEWEAARASMRWRLTSLVTGGAPGEVRRRLKSALVAEGLHESTRGAYVSSPTQCATIVETDGFLAQPTGATGWTMNWTVSSMEKSVAPRMEKLLAAMPSLRYGRVPAGVLERLNSLEVAALSVGRVDWEAVVRVSDEDQQPLVESLVKYLKAAGFERMAPKASLVMEFLHDGTYVSIQHWKGAVRVHVAPHS